MPPYDISISNNTVIENSSLGTLIGNITVKDYDKNDFFNLSILS